MPEVIAGTYQIIKQIGAGGGGIVFLARHLRLEKNVVLKADKRKLTTRPELLRIEVDVLKHLSHTYIPQVYDFFVENETVYTAMEYIEGDSFDRILKHGEPFSQAQVIKWGMQLLEALAYLHSPTHGDPPHGYTHSDIKPANLMLTPAGNICLIDFNISLALGEEMIIGRSEGYASPEHYGLDFSTEGSYRADGNTAGIGDGKTGPVSAVRKTISTIFSRSSSGSTGAYRGTSRSGYRLITPDVRSDIYSVGATLYHLLSGRRPASQAKKVEPLSAKEFSPQLAHIINRAMEPNPNLRYQTADEMLEAFRHIRENDSRVRRLRLERRIVCTGLTALCITGAGTSFVGLKRMETAESWKKLAEYSRNALQEGDLKDSLRYALQAFPEKQPLIQPAYIAEAQKALTDAVGVYDLADGYKPHGTVELPSAPLGMAIAPDGTTLSCVYASAVAVYDTRTCTLLATLPAAESALSEVRYLDADTILYAGKAGISRYDIREGAVGWTGQPATGICISADGKRAAGVYRDESSITVYDTETGQVLRRVGLNGRHQSVTVNDIFANPNDNLLALNADGTLLAVSMSDGSLELFDLKNEAGNRIIMDQTSGYTHFEGGFYQNYFAFSASGVSESVFAVIDTSSMEQTGGFQSDGCFHVQTDETGIYVQTDNLLVEIDPVSGEQRPLVTTTENIHAFARSTDHTLIATEGAYSFFDSHAVKIAEGEKKDGTDFVQTAEGMAVLGSRSTPSVRLMTYENHKEAEVFTYDPAASHDEARVSADGERVMLFSWQRFRIYDRSGKLVNETELPDSEQIYDQQFRRNGNESYLEVIYNDGRSRIYSAADGALLREVQNAVPDGSMYEEFHVNGMRIESPLHGAPVAYDEKTGKQIRVLSEEDYLTYVTPVGDQMVAQFITADGYGYGQLLSADCEVLAELPYLCDVINHVLVFDYPTGNLRQSHIFDIEQLLTAAQNILEEGQ
ncbi:MAG: protein kinase [Clostridiales bacterium]|nr:protein kinase [Clostridiales bacterium]